MYLLKLKKKGARRPAVFQNFVMRSETAKDMSDCREVKDAQLVDHSNLKHDSRMGFATYTVHARLLACISPRTGKAEWEPNTGQHHGPSLCVYKHLYGATRAEKKSRASL
jgi:hypothetical protein